MRPMDPNDPETVRDVARKVEEIRRVLPYTRGEFRLPDIVQAISKGEMQWWNAGPGSFAATTLDKFGDRLVCTILLAAGNMREVHGALPSIEEWAQEQGCAAVTIVGRRGWVRQLADDGYTESAVILHKEF